jgi:outer membrane biosynthesis protein TonB
MAGTPYIRFFGDDWLSGTQSLTLEERGVLITLVALTATAGEAPAYDVERLARRLGCTRAKTIKLMNALCETGKITIEDGRIYQPRALKETKKAQENSEKQTKIANARWSRLDVKTNENKPADDATALPRECQLEPEPEPETIGKPIVVHASVPPPIVEQPKRSAQPKSGARGSRIPANWTPTPKDYAFASSEGLTREEINREADRFRDYWIAASGRTACKLDWEATWRNWIRSDLRKRPGSGAGNASRNGSRTGAFDRLAERLSDSAPRADAWQHDDSGAEGGDIIDIGPAQLTG